MSPNALKPLEGSMVGEEGRLRRPLRLTRLPWASFHWILLAEGEPEPSPDSTRNSLRSPGPCAYRNSSTSRDLNRKSVANGVGRCLGPGLQREEQGDGKGGGDNGVSKSQLVPSLSQVLSVIPGADMEGTG